jgi:hypothetical protein
VEELERWFKRLADYGDKNLEKIFRANLCMATSTVTPMLDQYSFLPFFSCREVNNECLCMAQNNERSKLYNLHMEDLCQ